MTLDLAATGVSRYTPKRKNAVCGYSLPVVANSALAHYPTTGFIATTGSTCVTNLCVNNIFSGTYWTPPTGTTSNVTVVNHTTTTTGGSFIGVPYMDTEYVLCGALELGEITALEYALLRGEPSCYQQVRHSVDSGGNWIDHFLENTVAEYLGKTPVEKIYPQALAALPALAMSLEAFKSDAEWQIREKLLSDLERKPESQLIFSSSAFMHSQRWRTLEERLVTGEADITQEVVEKILKSTSLSLVTRWRRDLALIEGAFVWLKSPEGQAFLNAQEESVLREIQTSPFYQPPSYLPSIRIEEAIRVAQERIVEKQAVYEKQRAQWRRRKELPQIKKARSAIKKVTKLFDKLGQREDLRLFMGGDEVVFSHPDSKFKYVMKAPQHQNNWLVEKTLKPSYSTPFDLMVLTKDDVFLAKLCLFLRDTPVLDQLLAFSLFIHSGEEEDLLLKANWHSYQDWDEEKYQYCIDAVPALEKKISNPKRLNRFTSVDVDGATIVCPTIPEDPNRVFWEEIRPRITTWINNYMAPFEQVAQRFLAI